MNIRYWDPSVVVELDTELRDGDDMAYVGTPMELEMFARRVWDEAYRAATCGQTFKEFWKNETGCEPKQPWALVAQTCVDCGDKLAVLMLEREPDDFDKRLVSDELGGMNCIRVRVAPFSFGDVNVVKDEK